MQYGRLDHGPASGIMTPEHLLQHYQGIGPLYEIRESAVFAELAAAIPDDPQAYVQVVDDFFGPLDGDFEQLYDEPLYETAERLQEILRELYYYDFRTLEALLLECDLAMKDRTESGFGCDPTSALASKLPPRGRAFADDQTFLRKVEPYLASPDMRHNIRGVRQRILRRSPGLKVTPDNYPPT
jgi:hypothetical protein